VDVAEKTRRQFLSLAGAAVGGAGVAGVIGFPSGVGASTRPKRRVAVLGGGVGGLTTAHELAERGFDVTVVEPKAFGGKARSIRFRERAPAAGATCPASTASGSSRGSTRTCPTR
jgi:NADPH-dependent 2,4-dienoyl-CoA reductase/sulfur reductase-like enzyme